MLDTCLCPGGEGETEYNRAYKGDTGKGLKESWGIWHLV